MSRGLSQAQLAGPDLSDSYVSLIEANKRTPTVAVLTLLAERLGCSPEFLAEGVEPAHLVVTELKLIHAERSLRAGDPDSAYAGFDDVLRMPDLPVTSDLVARARLGRAEALARRGYPREAVALLRELATEGGRDPHRPVPQLPLFTALCRCQRMAGDTAAAVAAGETCLDLLARIGLGVAVEAVLPGGPAAGELLELAVELLGAYVEQGELDQAAALGAGVLDRAGDPPPAAAAGANRGARCYWRASTAARDAGMMADARRLAERAAALDTELRAHQDLCRIRIRLGWLLLRRPGPDLSAALAALGPAERDLAALGPLADAADLARCRTEMARAMVLLDEPAEAVALVGAALRDLGEAPRLESAHAHLVLGQARFSLGDREAALASFRTAARQLELLPAIRGAAQTWREVGDLLGHAGDATGMTAAYQRALEHVGLRPSGMPRPG